jgi:hypothetical protein
MSFTFSVCGGGKERLAEDCKPERLLHKKQPFQRYTKAGILPCSIINPFAESGGKVSLFFIAASFFLSKRK